jgi:putative ABC transport system permease protein
VRVIAFAAVLTLFTGLLFGLAPAWHAARLPLADALRAGGRSATSGAGAFRALLATGEIAVAVMLVAGAGLLLRTLASLHQVNPGYRAGNVLTMYVSVPSTRYSGERLLNFYQSVEREIGSVPGVRAVAIGDDLPLDGWTVGQGFSIVGAPDTGLSNRPSAHYQMVGASYFETMGIELLAGRGFNEHDAAGSTPVCVVNEEFARRYLQGRQPIGTLISVDAMGMTPKAVTREIVGVIKQVKVMGPGEEKNAVEIYVPLAQNPWTYASIVVRTANDPMGMAPAVKAAIARVDKDQPVTQIRTMEQVAAESVSQPRFRAELVGAFAGLAMVLAAVGIFGVLAFSVSQRTREFGIRMALGARAGDVLSLVISSGLKITAAGIVIGLAAAAALTRSLSSLLFGVKPLDPLTFLAAPALLALVALIACAAPALRAAGVDPAVALRQE